MADPPKIPKYGDPEILPKGTVRRPVGGVGRQSPYDQRGVLLPRGPRFPAELRAPDIERFKQWKRKRGDEWTTETTRGWILDFLAQLFRDHPEWDRWELDEKFGLPRSPQGTIDPFLRLRVYRLRGGSLVGEVGVSFAPAEIASETLFRAKLALARQALEAQA